MYSSFFSLQTPYPQRNLNIFYEALKNWKQAKSMSREYIPQKISEVTIPATNKYVKLKV